MRVLVQILILLQLSGPVAGWAAWPESPDFKSWLEGFSGQLGTGSPAVQGCPGDPPGPARATPAAASPLRACLLELMGAEGDAIYESFMLRAKKRLAPETPGKPKRSGLYARVVLPEGLDFEEYLAILFYTNEGYRPMNAALRAGGQEADRARGCTDTLNSALDALPPASDELVYRGADLPPEVVVMHSDGARVRYPAFTSTSSDEPFSGRDQFVLLSQSGRNVSPYSDAPHEKEILFKAPTCFEVAERIPREDLASRKFEEPWSRMKKERLGAGEKWSNLYLMKEVSCED